MFTEFNRIFSLEVDLKNLEVTYNSKALYTNVDLNTSTMMIKMSLDQNALDLTGKTVNAFIKTGIDKNITMQRCEILEATEGIIGLDFKSSALKAGTNTFFLEIKSENEEIINSPLITYKVVELFDTYGSIEGDNNVSILTELITEVDIAKGSVEDLRNEITEQERQREEAEASRKNNESSRIQAETNRTNSESTRVTNENNRKQAESTRESNETERVNAENLRESAENTRKQEETKRSQNESLRVESEKERVLSYEEIKNNNAIFKEQMNTDFGNAKTDYFGEEHPNVVERLNSDFDNLHQRMNDSSLLQYEGTSIKADNSYYGLTKDMVIKGRTLQNLYGGKTIFNKNKDGIIAIQGNSKNGANSYIPYSNLGLIKPNTVYTIVYNVITNTTDNTPQLYSSSVTILQETVNLPKMLGLNKAIFKTKELFDSSLSSGLYLHLSGNNTTTDTTNELSLNNIIILEGDHTNTPIEDLPFGEGIYSVGENEVTEDGKYKISGKSCGKNLFDINAKAYTSRPYTVSMVINECLITITSTSPVDWDSFNIKVDRLKYNTYYIISFENVDYPLSNRYIALYEKNTNILIGSADTPFKIPETINLDNVYIRVHLNKAGTTYTTCTVKNIQLEEGTVATDYEPYQESTYSYILDEPLRSLPNGVCDEIVGNKAIRRVGKFILDGSESWRTSTVANQINETAFAIENYLASINCKMPSTVTVLPNLLCDKLPRREDTYNGTNGECIVFAPLSNLFIRVSKSKLVTQDISGLKTWLSQNPTTVYYELAEPIVTELNETLQLKSYEGTTHIISDNYLMPIASAKIPSNVQAVVSSLINENKELTNEVSTLNIENEKLKQTNEIQDELIDINMCATDEMYVLLEPLLAQSISTMSLERGVSKMVDLYVAMIQRGLKTIEQVPERYREQVREVLEQLEK